MEKDNKNNLDKKMKKKRVLRYLPLMIVGGLVVGAGLTYISFYVANTAYRSQLISYIDSFDKVEYDNQLVPEKDEATGYYTFKTDNDLKILQLTDIHIGGGYASQVNDRKTIYEVYTILQKEKPDLVVVDGDNTFCVPGPIFRGGGTYNNKETAKVVIHMFEHAGVYFSTVFGNHDTESFDYCNRVNLGKLYMSDEYKYCIFDQDFTETAENGQTSVTNQCIVVKNSDDTIRKAIMLVDSNAYNSNSLSATINWDYDTIHQPQVEWAESTLNSLSEIKGSTVKSLFFFHIPFGEFHTAYKEYEANNFQNTENVKYISGIWDEEVNEEYGIRIWYGGCTKKDVKAEDCDQLFETVGPDGINSMEAVFCGHDHTNNAVVEYKGVTFSYGYSIDNLAYKNIMYYGLQRGCTVINLKADGTWSQEHKNVYLDEGADPNKFVTVNMTDYYYSDYAPTAV